MKIWWPWRPRKPQPHTQAYPKNAPGPFYVVNEECIICGAPHAVAPDLMAWDDDESGHCHCYFNKQPETPGEVDRAISAIKASCCGALEYAGNDPYVLRQLRRGRR